MLAYTLILFAILLFNIGTVFSQTPIPQDLVDMVIAYAPKVHLHSREEFFPSSVEYFFQHVQMNDQQNQPVSRSFLSSLVSAPTENLVMKSPEFIEDKGVLPWFRGQSVTEQRVPIYIMIVPKDEAKTVLEVYYYAFFPYNRGKDICIGLKIKGRCLGKTTTFGNHIGDWEHVRIQFTNKVPANMHFRYHSFGIDVPWNDARIQKIGTHPVVYNALGSHGMNYEPKDRTYKKVGPLKLIDNFDQGSGWVTWESNPEVFMKTAENTFIDSSGNSSAAAWWNFRGRWGNQRVGCKFLDKVHQTVCDNLEDGPNGPTFN
ncbi:hypothetical protein BKA69DRAFT_1120693 [Paraphysoderma sedebokerense]|nr:hypothetical protein BKA69DRAFT_1120693 [Paraphysoderma sedebokerense]